MTETPNILLIMADQFTPYMMNTYGCKVAKTPNLDKLGCESAVFENAYSNCPVCAPARASMMAGLYCSKTEVYDNGTIMPSDIPTFADYLNHMGYDTVLSGKMHFIGPDQLHGFSKRLTSDVYPASNAWLYDARMNKREKVMGDVGIKINSYIKAEGLQKKYGIMPNPKFFNYDDETAMQAKSYIRDANKKKKPFCLCASFHHPHMPLKVTKRLWDLYENVEIPMPTYPENMEEKYSDMDKWVNHFTGADEYKITNMDELKEARRCYLALTSYIDEKVGELLEELEENGLAENTIVMFTSDHGDMLGEKGMVEKRVFYEWSAKVPMLIKFPNKEFAGQRITAPVSLIDILPTILDIVNFPKESTLPYDGKSMLAVAKGEINEPVYSEFHVEGVKSTCFMLRNDRYKYIYITGFKHQLFNLENDKDEWNNLIDDENYSKIKNAMKQQILDKFNPEKIENDIQHKLTTNAFIRKSTMQSKVNWAYVPKYENISN
ncbi:MAG: choline-sulfatase [Clostridia bacterium]